MCHAHGIKIQWPTKLYSAVRALDLFVYKLFIKIMSKINNLLRQMGILCFFPGLVDITADADS